MRIIIIFKKGKQGGSKVNEKVFGITRFYYDIRMYASFSRSTIRTSFGKCS
ncbi:hypothetical protein BACI71_110592 [Bacillus mycoides]|uniref:Uncharacterized protein n=1 Tax=Bacillus mycoides TaxID=1405 RepID=A0A653QYM6_BACMY|nr:hypothetical protein BACI71_110592 [Bacillus mycoides]